MFDFKRLLSPEQRRELEHAEQERQRFRAMSTPELAKALAYYRSNSAGPRHADGTFMAPGYPVYDAALHHLLLPEAIDRLRAAGEALEQIRAVAEEQLTAEAWSDVKSVMRGLERIRELASGKTST